MAGDELMSAPAVSIGVQRRRRSALGWANRAATVALVSVLAVLALGVGLRVAGLTPLVDHSASMAPAIQSGDVLLARNVGAEDLAARQIATLRDPISGRLITHRVVSVTREDGRVTVVTRGDANDSSERWVLRSDASVQRMVARVPAAGRALIWLSSPLPRLLLATLGASLLAAALLRRIWSDA
jgi:signal peptidase I